MTRAEHVRREGLEIRALRRLKHGRQPTVVLPQPIPGQKAHDGFTDAVVNRLGDLAVVAEAHPREPLILEERERIGHASLDLRSRSEGRDGEGPSRNGHGLGQPARLRREAVKALADHLLEGDDGERRGRRADPVAMAPHELLDEEGASPRLVHDSKRRPLAKRVRRTEERQRQEVRLAGRQRTHVDLAHVARPAGRHLHQKRTRVRVFLSRRHHEKQRRRVRRPHDFDEQRDAVGVAPLNVVDENDEGTPPGKRREAFAQRPERASPLDLRVVLRRAELRAQALHAP